MENQQPQTKRHLNGAPRKLLRFLGGMPFSIILLLLIIAACVAGSVIPQNNAQYVYIERYGANWGRLLCALRLDRVFTCWWFIALAALLCLNLVLCSVSRFPGVYRAWKAQGKRYVGIWGSWLTHLGMLLLIVSFAAGQLLSREAVVYGIPGSTQPLGDTGLQLTIDSFDVSLREDDTVEQYTAALTVTGKDGTVVSGTASVNHPFPAFGYSFYQDSMGWASYVDIYKDGELVKTDLLCTGEYTAPDDMPNLALLFNKFYPDLVRGEDGTLSSASSQLNNPHCLYSIYYNGTPMSMDLTEPGAPIPVHNYTFTMYDPTEYTLIVAKSDPTTPLVALSAAILLAGLFLSFYVRPWEENRRKQSHDEPLSE